MTRAAADLVVRGMVQGVGYRYFCYRKASDCGVTGWVRNDPDGSVSLRIEGEKAVLVDLIALLRKGPATGLVNDIEIVWRDYSGTMNAFEVKM